MRQGSRETSILEIQVRGNEDLSKTEVEGSERKSRSKKYFDDKLIGCLYCCGKVRVYGLANLMVSYGRNLMEQ